MLKDILAQLIDVETMTLQPVLNMDFTCVCVWSQAHNSIKEPNKCRVMFLPRHMTGFVCLYLGYTQNQRISDQLNTWCCKIFAQLQCKLYLW